MMDRMDSTSIGRLMAMTTNWNLDCKEEHPMTILPPEVRGEIFNKLPQKQAVELRLVCKQWNQDIKDYFNFNITLDVESPFLKHIFQLRIVGLNIRKLRQGQIGFPTSDNRPEDGSLTIFKHPNLIRRVTVLWSLGPYENGISPDALNDFLNLCQKSIIQLDLPYPYPFRKWNYNFENVKCFKINIDYQGIGIGTTNMATNNKLFTLIVNSDFPNLESLEVNMFNSSPKVNLTQLTHQIFKLMTKNPKGLKRIKVDLYGKADGTDNSIDLDLSPKELVAFSAITNLKQIHLYSKDHERSELESMQGLWVDLMLRQRSLDSFKLGDNWDDSKPISISGCFLKSIVLNNLGTLVVVDIERLNVNGEMSFDLSAFQNCHKLKELSLRKNERFPSRGFGPDLEFSSPLPRNLRRLELINFKILSTDLLALFAPNMLPDGFKDLLIGECGHIGNFGVNSVVFNLFLATISNHNNSDKTVILSRERFPRTANILR